MTWVLPAELSAFDVRDDTPPRAAASGRPVSAKREQEKLESLTNKRAALEQRRADLDSDRQRLSYDATAAGDKTAKRDLAESTKASVETALALQNLDHAIAESRRRVEQARQAEARAQRIDEARRAQDISRELAELGQLGAEAVVAAIARLKRYLELADEAHRLGCCPTGALTRVNLKRELLDALVPLGCGELLQPSQRRGLGALLAGYAQHTAASAARILGELDESEAA